MKRAGIPTWAINENRYFPGLFIPLYRPTGERISGMFKPRVPVPNRDGPVDEVRRAEKTGRPSSTSTPSTGTASSTPPCPCGSPKASKRPTA
jgi:hypothetical protein